MTWYQLLQLLLTDDGETTVLTSDDGTVLLASDDSTGGAATSTWTPDAGVT